MARRWTWTFFYGLRILINSLGTLIELPCKHAATRSFALRVLGEYNMYAANVYIVYSYFSDRIKGQTVARFLMEYRRHLTEL